jgi:competence protein ComEA
MGMSAPWRALEAPDDAPAESTPRLTRPSSARLMLVAVGVLLLIGIAAVAAVELQGGGHVQVVSGPAGPGGSAIAASPAMVVVQVAGAVQRPGVYSLPVGSRVEDAIREAGGYSTDVDARAAETRINLAAKLTDAQLIVIPRRGEASGGPSDAAASSLPSGPVNLNTATAEQLDSLPGIGPATAAKIIASREQLPFSSVDDLVSRKLVSASTLAKFRDQVTV